MVERVSVGELLRRAGEVFDSPASGLAQSSRQAYRTLFRSGGLWMKQALEALRGDALPGSVADLNRLGVLKYGLAAFAGLLWVLLTLWLGLPGLACLAVLVFYAVEARMVFLFPLALDGVSHPARVAGRWTRHAGGTLVVMRVVLPLAGTMLFGGFLGRGFVRSWCLGCLAICVWYEHLRRHLNLQGQS